MDWRIYRSVISKLKRLEMLQELTPDVRMGLEDMRAMGLSYDQYKIHIKKVMEEKVKNQGKGNDDSKGKENAKDKGKEDAAAKGDDSDESRTYSDKQEHKDAVEAAKKKAKKEQDEYEQQHEEENQKDLDQYEKNKEKIEKEYEEDKQKDDVSEALAKQTYEDKIARLDDDLEDSIQDKKNKKEINRKGRLAANNPKYLGNWYYKPISNGDRPMFLQGFSALYLLQLCYSLLLTVQLDDPYFLFPAWLTRIFILKHQAKMVAGTVEGTCLAFKKGWAINIGGGFSQTSRKQGGYHQAYCDVRLAVNNAKRNHFADRILIINTCALFGEPLIKDFQNSRKVIFCEIYNPKAKKVPNSLLKRV